MTPSYFKHCKTTQEYDNEAFIYLLGLAYTPILRALHPPLTLELEYLNAIPYMDHPDGFDPSALAEVISDFHLLHHESGFTICHHDNQPANILFDGQKYYLIDFSDTRREAVEHDLSHLMLFWAEEYEPPLFEQLCRDFLRSYEMRIKIDPHRFGIYLSQNILRFDERRRKYSRIERKQPALAEQNRAFLACLFSPESSPTK